MTNLKLWRLSNHLTQTEAAQRCDLGLSAYSLIESGRLRPSLDQVRRLGRVFGRRTEEMLRSIPAVHQ